MKLQISAHCVVLETLLLYCFQHFECMKLDGYDFPVYTTEFCPKNQTEWNERSSAINCTESNGYMCLPSENITMLLEFCYTYPSIFMEEGYCFYLYKRPSIVHSYSCRHFIFGCPSSSFPSNQIFKYPSCISIGDGCFRDDPSCKSSTTYLEKPLVNGQAENVHINEKRNSTTSSTERTTKHIKTEAPLIIEKHDLVWIPPTVGMFILIGILFLILCVPTKRNYLPCKRNMDVERQDEERLSNIKISTKNESELCKDKIITENQEESQNTPLLNNISSPKKEEQDIFDTPASQYYVDCASCKEQSDFYCNNCHQRMCGNCMEEHLGNPDNEGHTICRYEDRKWIFPSVPCKLHPRNKLAIYCKECQRAICATCTTKDHENHGFLDLEEVYTEKIKKAFLQIIRFNLNIPSQPNRSSQKSMNKALNREEKDTYLKNLIEKPDSKIKTLFDKTLIESAHDVDINEGCSDVIMSLFLLDIFW